MFTVEERQKVPVDQETLDELKRQKLGEKIELAGFDPDEPRDDHGQWTGGGSIESVKKMISFGDSAYDQAAHSVIDYMPGGSLKRFGENVGTVSVSDKIDDEFRSRSVGPIDPSVKIGGFTKRGKWTPERGTTYDVVVRAGMSKELARDAFAHEFSHVIDQGVSDSAEWYRAYTQEIKPASGDAPLSNYARQTSREGFAEFGRLVFSRPREARERFPLSWAVWKDRGLV